MFNCVNTVFIYLRFQRYIFCNEMLIVGCLFRYCMLNECFEGAKLQNGVVLVLNGAVPGS